MRRLQDAAKPLAGECLHPAIGAAVLLLLCLLVGVLVHAGPGRWVRARLEGTLFQQIPGYRLLRTFVTEEMPGAGSGHRPRPALGRIEEGLCPALIMDRSADGRVVFVPGTPAPMSGALYIFTADRVVELEVPLLPFLKAVSSWGLGLLELIGQAGTTDAAARIGTMR